MTKTKRSMSLLLSLVIVLSVFSIVPFNIGAAEAEVAAAAESEGDYLYFVLGDNTAEISGYTGDGGDVAIPSSIDGHIVSSIGGAFYNCASLTSVDIPDSVTRINIQAFHGCTGLTSITIPNSVTSIGESAFSRCTGLTSITIPDSVTSIGDYAFSHCTGLTSITVPDSAVSFGIDAFSDTAWYDNQPEGLVYVGKTAYKMKGACPSEVVIKDGTLAVAGSAFYGCESLTDIDIPDSVTSIGSRAFFGCTGLMSVTIPDSVTRISDGTFYDCKSLTSATISDSAASIDMFAFYDCISLTNIIIPDSVTSIDSYAFAGCTNLTSVTIPDSVTSIGGWAFYGCVSLMSVIIPDSVTSIGDYAFGYYYDYEAGSQKNVDGFLIYGYNDTASKYASKNQCRYTQIIGTCDDCHNLITTLDVQVRINATCTEDGALYWHCGNCDKLGEFVKPALGHDYQSVVKPPTCTSNGYTIHTCSICGHVYHSDKIKATGHNYSSVFTPPTCTEDGGTVHTCSVGGDVYYTDKVEALGHDCPLDVKRQPTATQQGVIAIDCSRCGMKKNVLLPVLNGYYYTITKSTEPGKVTYTLKEKIYGKVAFVADAPEEWHESDYIPGDITGDGKTNVQDCTAILRYVRKLDTLDDYQLSCADVTGDGKVNVQDVTRILRHVRKIEELY